MADDEDKIQDCIRHFEDFLREDVDFGDDYVGTYEDQIRDMIDHSNVRLVIDIAHLMSSPNVDTDDFFQDPKVWIYSWERRLNEVIREDFEEDYQEMVVSRHVDKLRFRIGLSGSFGSYFLSPRDLKARYLNSLVRVEGILSHVGVVVPRVLMSVHYCDEISRFHVVHYRDETSLVGLPTSTPFPKTYPQTEHPMEVEYGYCTHKDTQSIVVQEMPENAPPGQLPRSITCHLEDDLVDQFKPGDRVHVVGVFRPLPAPKTAGRLSGVMKSVLTANNILPATSKLDAMTGPDVSRVRSLAEWCMTNGVDVAELLSRSVAPSIWGHEDIKRALLLQLAGGVEKELRNGIHLRGDIHILMVGDPSTAKSQFLRFALNVAPISISTTGRASTGVGLTAAVVRDADTGENTLAAGAMVLGDRGVVCVDEFDKMSEVDRTSMHEVMEQQTVTIQKAGVHSTLNARCSVLAAANPIYGNYEPKISVQKNVGLPDSLLSRFDLVFIVLDHKDPDLDRAISSHVLRLHMNFESREEQTGRQVEWRTPDGSLPWDLSDESLKLPVDFLRMYLRYCRIRFRPALPEELVEAISTRYAELREAFDDSDARRTTLPITPRTLEALVRLISAHARLRMANEVELQDIEYAFRLMERTILVDASGVSGGERVQPLPEDQDPDLALRTGQKRVRGDPTGLQVQRDGDGDVVMRDEGPAEEGGLTERLKGILETVLYERVEADEPVLEILGFVNQRLRPAERLTVETFTTALDDSGLPFTVMEDMIARLA